MSILSRIDIFLSIALLSVKARQRRLTYAYANQMTVAVAPIFTLALAPHSATAKHIFKTALAGSSGHHQLYADTFRSFAAVNTNTLTSVEVHSSLMNWPAIGVAWVAYECVRSFALACCPYLVPISADVACNITTACHERPSGRTA